MRIVHIAPNSPYNDNWGYQDNLLPKYQQKMGNEVTIIVTVKKHEDGRVVEGNEGDYLLDDGVRVIRKRYKQFGNSIITNTMSYIPVISLLREIKPDFIFFHGLISTSIFDAIKYKEENPRCIIVQDNHMDFNIGYKAGTFKQKLLRCWLRAINKKSIKHVARVYGVTPWRKQYAHEYFKIPESKLDVLIMGADDEKMHLNNRKQLRDNIRTENGIPETDYLIVTGGKIDKKKKVDLLVSACAGMEGVSLLVFGSITDECKKVIDRIAKGSENIHLIGWINSDEVYGYFYAADLVFFPGQHSVLWEQACASKVPCVFEKWNGMDHVNNGGNSDFIDNVSEESIKQKIKELLWTEKYFGMKEIAESSKTDIYRYSEIAKKSIECADSNL